MPKSNFGTRSENGRKMGCPRSTGGTPITGCKARGCAIAGRRAHKGDVEAGWREPHGDRLKEEVFLPKCAARFRKCAAHGRARAVSGGPPMIFRGAAPILPRWREVFRRQEAAFRHRKTIRRRERAIACGQKTAPHRRRVVFRREELIPPQRGAIPRRKGIPPAWRRTTPGRQGTIRRRKRTALHHRKTILSQRRMPPGRTPAACCLSEDGFPPAERRSALRENGCPTEEDDFPAAGNRFPLRENRAPPEENRFPLEENNPRTPPRRPFTLENRPSAHSRPAPSLPQGRSPPFSPARRLPCPAQHPAHSLGQFGIAHLAKLRNGHAHEKGRLLRLVSFSTRENRQK